MSDEVFEAIANATSGFVEAPAGCGKTEAIVRTVGAHCNDPQLILTHTHAGVDALRQRFRQHQVPASRFRVDTIAGWAWGWVRKYPDNASYHGSTEFAEWNDVYSAMSNLLQKDFVTVRSLTRCPSPRSRSASRAALLHVQRSGPVGSPRVTGSS